jgi:photosystem II stability/assembly factor-like uncharacterized protein
LNMKRMMMNRSLTVFALFWLLASTASAQEFPWSIQTQVIRDDSLGGGIYLSGIVAPDTLHAMAFGHTGLATVARTTDGGNTWPITLRLGFRIDGSLNDLAHPTPNVAVVVGDTLVQHGDTGVTIFYTHNGGESWQQAWCDSYLFTDGTRLSIFRIAMCDSMNGILTSYGHLLARTTDGGATWRRMKDPTNGQESFYQLHPFTPSTYFLITYDFKGAGRMYRTTDSGTSWTRDEQPLPDRLGPISFTNQMDGWACGSFEDSVKLVNMIFRTRDGGRTWDTLFKASPFGRAGGLLTIAMADSTHGIATGGNGLWLYTTDGDHWNTGANIDSMTRIRYGYGIDKVLFLAYPHPNKGWGGSTNSAVFVYRPQIAAVPGPDRTSSHEATSVRVAPNIARTNTPITITMHLRERTSAARLVICDVLGRNVYVTAYGTLEAGDYNVTHTAALPTGRYFVRLVTEQGTTTTSLLVSQ